MEHFKFSIMTTLPNDISELEIDLENIFVALEKDVFVTSIDIGCHGGEDMTLLVGSWVLTGEEIEAKIIKILGNTGRDLQNYLVCEL